LILSTIPECGFPVERLLYVIFNEDTRWRKLQQTGKIIDDILPALEKKGGCIPYFHPLEVI
jgi:hypothetical protein